MIHGWLIVGGEQLRGRRVVYVSNGREVKINSFSSLLPLLFSFQCLLRRKPINRSPQTFQYIQRAFKSVFMPGPFAFTLNMLDL